MQLKRNTAKNRSATMTSTRVETETNQLYELAIS